MNKTIAIISLVSVLLCWSLTSSAWASPQSQAINEGKSAVRQEEKYLKPLLAKLAAALGQSEVTLTVPGTVTTVIKGGGLTLPRPWTPAEKKRLDTGRVNPSLPAPAGVWK